MRYIDNGIYYSVQVSRSEVYKFKQQWPCSGLPNRTVTFQFDKRNGDLVDILPYTYRYDGEDLAALSQDARAYGLVQIERL